MSNNKQGKIAELWHCQDLNVQSSDNRSNVFLLYHLGAKQHV